MRTQFDNELALLKQQFSVMFDAVLQSLEQAVEALETEHLGLAQEIIDYDKVINQQEIEIESHCTRLIALQQPVVKDLRIIVSLIKVSSDLERMGDHAASVAKGVLRSVKHAPIEGISPKLRAMAEAVIQMGQATKAAYLADSDQEARRVAMMDAEVDQHMKSVAAYCREHMKDNPKFVSNGSEYISMAGHLERIGDYMTNICENVIYIQTGQIVELGDIDK